jgi:hypothetical protein
MSLTLKDIAVKLLRGELPPMSSDEISSERLKVCEACPHMKKLARQCELCGCFLDLKTKLLEAECPINKW